MPPDAGIAVAVVDDGRIVHTGTYGLRDRQRGLPVTNETRFEICSLTKAFTSAAFLVAAADGTLDLDAPINASYELLTLSDPTTTRAVSIADVLSHRTGLPSNDLLWVLGAVSRETLGQASAELELLPSSLRQTFVYNNLLYGALGERFPDLAGDSWEAFVSTRLLRPLGMTSTAARCAPDDEDVALPYSGVEHIARADTSAVAAAAGLSSTLGDMARWLQFQLTGRSREGHTLLSDAAFERIQSPHVGVKDINPILFMGLEWLGTDVAYGLGWFLATTRGERVAFHPGLVNGFSNAIVMLPDRKAGVVVMTNVNLNGTPGLLARELLREWFPDAVPAPAAGTMARLDIAGTYVHPVYGEVRVVSQGERWQLRYGSHEWQLTWKVGSTAEFAVAAFGVQLPLSLQVRTTGGEAVAVDIPFSLDPRVPAQRFKRRQ